MLSEAFVLKDGIYEINALVPPEAKPAPLLDAAKQDQQELTIQESCGIFPNQVFVGNRIVQRMYDSKAFDPSSFTNVSFAFAVRSYNLSNMSQLLLTS